ncbi:mannitol repressor, MtlR [Psychromonas ingrahamii 37]|uniref:Mannitol repressor, MtlR n=1 Tax=Psychromonas ingrahamii (strain DSM 17664 / CCUG 51855 / 37) TaxID=357804 RepID=A1STK9_PSYIN|nr:MltR family transcriptional regulator [Psychromonas ingrahamii]ABM02824.1 mannitol repressor, MtlR [Psychromonas ingrahamii 37]
MPTFSRLKFDIDIVETLSEAETAYVFFTASFDLFEDAIDILIQNVFRKDDYAVKYAVEPLLNNDGPLAQLAIRIKLLYGLGLLSQDAYQDIEKFIALKTFVQSEGESIDFLSPLLFERINAISAVAEMIPINADDNQPEESSHFIVQMKLDHNRQVIKSSLILAITEIIKELHRDTSLS